MRTGVYLNGETDEVLSFTGDGEPPGPGWVYVDGDTSLGLLAIRELLQTHGLVRDASLVYWHMPQPVEETPLALVCDSTPAHERGGDRPALPRLRSSTSGRAG